MPNVNKTVVRYGTYLQDETHDVIRVDVAQMEDRELFSLDAKVGAVQNVIRAECDKRITAWYGEGLTDRAIGERVGVNHSTITRARARLGLERTDNRGGARQGLVQAHQNEDDDEPTEPIEGTSGEPHYLAPGVDDPAPEVPARRSVEVRPILSQAKSLLEMLDIKLSTGTDATNDNANDLVDAIIRYAEARRK